MANLIASPTPPPSPAAGDEWQNTANGYRYVWTVGTSGYGQWVQTNVPLYTKPTAAPQGAPPPAPDLQDAPITTAIPHLTVSPHPPSGAVDNDLWWSTRNGLLYIFYFDGDTRQWVVTGYSSTSGGGGGGGGGIGTITSVTGSEGIEGGGDEGNLVLFADEAWFDERYLQLDSGGTITGNVTVAGNLSTEWLGIWSNTPGIDFFKADNAADERTWVVSMDVNGSGPIAGGPLTISAMNDDWTVQAEWVFGRDWSFTVPWDLRAKEIKIAANNYTSLKFTALSGVAEARNWQFYAQAAGGAFALEANSDDWNVTQKIWGFNRNGNTYLPGNVVATGDDVTGITIDKFGWVSLFSNNSDYGGYDVWRYDLPPDQQLWFFGQRFDGAFHIVAASDDYSVQKGWIFNRVGTTTFPGVVTVPGLTVNGATNTTGDVSIGGKLTVSQSITANAGNFVHSGWTYNKANMNGTLPTLNTVGYAQGYNSNAAGMVEHVALIAGGAHIFETFNAGRTALVPGLVYAGTHPTPAVGNELTNAAWVRAQGFATAASLANYVLKAGDTMTGNLTVNAGILVPNDYTLYYMRGPTMPHTDLSQNVATTKYVRDLLAYRGLGYAVYLFGGTFAAGDPGSGKLNIAAGVGNDRIMAISKVDADGVGRYLLLMVTGDSLVLSNEIAPVVDYSRYDLIADPIDHDTWVELHAHLVDSSGVIIPTVGTRLKVTGFLNTATGDGPILGIEPRDGITPQSGGVSGNVWIEVDFTVVAGKAYVDGKFLPLAGGTLTGPLNGTTAWFSGDIRTGAAGLGYVNLVSGSATQAGYIAFHDPAGARIGWIGFELGHMKYYSEAGSNHDFTGSIITNAGLQAGGGIPNGFAYDGWTYMTQNMAPGPGPTHTSGLATAWNYSPAGQARQSYINGWPYAGHSFQAFNSDRTALVDAPIWAGEGFFSSNLHAGSGAFAVLPGWVYIGPNTNGALPNRSYAGGIGWNFGAGEGTVDFVNNYSHGYGFHFWTWNAAENGLVSGPVRMGLLEATSGSVSGALSIGGIITAPELDLVRAVPYIIMLDTNTGLKKNIRNNAGYLQITSSDDLTLLFQLDNAGNTAVAGTLGAGGTITAPAIISPTFVAQTASLPAYRWNASGNTAGLRWWETFVYTDGDMYVRALDDLGNMTKQFQFKRDGSLIVPNDITATNLWSNNTINSQATITSNTHGTDTPNFQYVVDAGHWGFSRYWLNGFIRWDVGHDNNGDWFMSRYDGAGTSIGRAFQISTATGAVSAYGGLYTGGIVLSGGLGWQPGSIYTDGNWGMIFRSAAVTPAMQYAWFDHSGAQLMSLDNANLLHMQSNPPAIQNDTAVATTKWVKDYAAGGYIPIVAGQGYAWQVKMSADQPMASGQNLKLLFDAVQFQRNGSNFSTTNNRVTPPAGLYYLSAQGRYGIAGGVSKNAYLWFRKNGVDLTPSHQYLQFEPDSGWGTSYTSALVEIAAGDYIECFGRSDASNGGTFVFTGSTAVWDGFRVDGVQGAPGIQGPPGEGNVGAIFRAHYSGAGVAVGGAGTRLIFNSLDYGNTGSFYNATTGIFAPPAGRYLIGWSVGYVAGGAISGEGFALRRNGVAIGMAANNTNAGWLNQAVNSVVLEAVAGDQFDIWGTSTQALTVVETSAIGTASSPETTLWAIPIGGMAGPQGPSGTGGAIPVGMVIDFAGIAANIPGGYVECNGQQLNRTTFATLYTALGGASSLWGQGDGSTTFNVPDLRGRMTISVDGGQNRVTAGVSGVDATVPGKVGGSQYMHAHAHGYTGSNQNAGVSGSGNAMQFQDTNSTGVAGSGGSQNMPPVGVVIKIIRTT